MPENPTIQILRQLFLDFSGGHHAEEINLLPASGSVRQYYRIKYKSGSIIGTYNQNIKENKAFFYLSNHFLRKGLNVPTLLNIHPSYMYYLQEDLGDMSLFGLINKSKHESGFNESLLKTYKEVIHHLIHFQTKGHEELDYSICFPREKFDKISMMWDMNYFKHYFLKLSDVPFDEQSLEDDFNTLVDFLEKLPSEYFMYRDFQSRNIMIKGSDLYFIDYQGGRMGPLQYDLGSLLFDAKADIPFEMREKLLEYYTETAPINDKIRFCDSFYPIVLTRMLQAFGAYGYRGYFERKSHFLQSIPYALTNLKWLMESVELPVKIPHLQQIFKEFIESPHLKQYRFIKGDKLTVSVHSFSYKKSIPIDLSGNGGGFVFDCRHLPNPGKYSEYSGLTGLDKPVIDYLTGKEEILAFLNDTFKIVDNAVKNYISRDFTHLMISYGCTGGQHRSVFCANQLSRHLKENYDIIVDVQHHELTKN